MLTVYEFCDMCYDPDEVVVTLYRNDNDDGKVFKGTMSDAMWSEYADYKVDSYDAILINNEITLNICE